MEKISAIVITCNEERNIGQCIDSLRLVADEIVILDSYSTDNTVSIARQKGAIVRQDLFLGHIEQKNKALGFTNYNYVLSLDADEVLSKQLAISILEEKKHFRYRAYFMNRYNNYCGQFIKHGLWYPNQKIRLFDKRVASWGGLNPHDKIELKEKNVTGFMKGDIIHYAYHSLNEHDKKNEKYSSIAAISLFEQGKHTHWSKILLSPAWSFFNGYFLRLGFLDGYYGFVIATKTAHQSFLKYQKLKQLQKQYEHQKEIKWITNN